VGTQYRPAIFYHSASQKASAEQAIAALNQSRRWSNPIVTEVVPFEVFYQAEDYHQEYFANNKYQPYCMAVVAPKVKKFRKQFFARLV
jgi:peptide-methionine (S)-S-oxide reductase